MKASITVLPGDGVGPEVISEAVRTLRAVGANHAIEFDLCEGLIGGAAIDATGDPLPPVTRTLIDGADAVLLGAVGGPKWSDPSSSVRPEQGLLGLRAMMGVFANLRPVVTHPALIPLSPLRAELLHDVDLMFVRELTGGLYFGDKTREMDAHGQWQRATDLCVYTADEVRRVVRIAGNLARDRRGRVTSVDKANVMETSRLWRAVTTQVMRDEFPEVALDHMLADAFAMQMLRTPA